MPIHGTLFTDYTENPTQDPFALQNKKLLKINMAYGQVWARTGSMVAYQGDVRFQNTGSGGMDKLLKSAMTGEGVDMMSCTGQGELFVADLRLRDPGLLPGERHGLGQRRERAGVLRLDRVGHPPGPGPRRR